MGEYLLLLRENEADYEGYTEDDFKELFGKFVSWSKELEKQGRLRGVAPLKEDGGGKTVRKRGGKLIVDGPFAEAKEAVVGYFVITAKDYEEAAEIAKGCPCMIAGGSVEIRELGAFPMPRAIL